eukprot:CAMPEP_0170632738 /NCGR_PEP_ID=MMETSP0224-20130122/35509_1 /TAXON_ID=285029 /ORGANISM="Togula jolla, Strain CCCM 725" /LENGTH=119 /DNA_ID=CAMNT_0010961513 /DNA_START=82 /DNA_END=441 /DNA_ORIENTATION=-
MAGSGNSNDICACHMVASTPICMGKPVQEKTETGNSLTVAMTTHGIIEGDLIGHPAKNGERWGRRGVAPKFAQPSWMLRGKEEQWKSLDSEVSLAVTAKMDEQKQCLHNPGRMSLCMPM